MLSMWTPRKASLVLGFIWAVWHLPAFFISGTPQTRLNLGVFFIGAISLSVLFTWLHVRTAGSLLLAILLHRMANADLTSTAFEPFAFGLAVVAVGLLLFGGMGERAPERSRIE